MRVDSVLDLIGNTPLVAAHELSPNPAVRLFVKLEGVNPGGSVKDRIAKSMIEDAEENGRLQPGDTILEPTSGNTGIGLALVCRVKGYKLRVVLPENVSVERRQLLEIFGAEVIPSPAAEGSNGAIRVAQELAKEGDVVFLYQYGNAANPKAHYEGTGPEIWAECPEVDAFVAGLGTSGTLMGVGRYLKERKPDVRIVAVEPPAGEDVQGLRSLEEGYIPPIFDPEAIDGKVMVRARESILWTRQLLQKEGIFAGISAGAVIWVAQRVSERLARDGGGPVVCLLADGGWKYMSTEAWTQDIDVAESNVEEVLWW
ncbi:MAG TPA: cysteine synthase family protein [Acidimicrobiia bacterium]|nr:cysteine synthase family protein [Acidimicrobiia bacterium]